MKKMLIVLAIFVMCVMCAAFLGGCAEDEGNDATEFVTEYVSAN